MSQTKTLSMAIDATNYTDDIYKIVKLIRPSWEPNSIQFKVFTDGITNQLIGCYESLKEDEMLLIRIYGKNTEIMINRQMERFTMQLLHSLSMSPPLYYIFDNGMCYGYQVGAPLDENSVRDEKISKLIAKEMARLHSIKPEKVEDPEIRSVLFNGKSILNTKLEAMFSNLPEKFEDEEKQARYFNNVISQFNLRQEFDDLYQHLKSCDFPIVFCHNDLLIKNIIYNDKTDVISFIDFEYTGLNWMAYDIANHFCEYAGVEEVDYTRYPNKEYQIDWLKSYLEYSQSFSESITEIKEKDVERLYVWVQKFSLASHLFWGVWALIQAKYSTISFDFLGYAILRLSEYKQRKKEIFFLEQPSS